jgi:hypothetical protein
LRFLGAFDCVVEALVLGRVASTRDRGRNQGTGHYYERRRRHLYYIKSQDGNNSVSNTIKILYGQASILRMRRYALIF